MNRRILITIVAVTAAVLVIFGVPLGIAIRRSYAGEATLTVQREAVLTSLQISDQLVDHNGQKFEMRSTSRTLFGFYDLDGRLITGDGPDVADSVTRSATSNNLQTVQTGETIVVAVPVADDGRMIGVVRAEQADEFYEGRVHAAFLLMAALGFVILVVAAGAGFWLARWLARPIRHTRDVAVAIGEGDFSARTTPVNVAEIDDLGAALNAMAGRIAVLVDRERAFSADVSHQLRTPLTGLRLSIENELITPRDDHRQILNEALVDIDRLSDTIDDLLALARDAPLDRGPIDIAAVASSVDESWRTRLERKDRRLAVATDPDALTVRVLVAQRAIAQALEVLMSNAWAHGDGTVTLEFERVGSGLVIAVSDEGPGIEVDPESLFRRRNPDAAGHGIGLALARTLVEAEGGRLVLARAKPNPRFEIVLAPDGHGD
ncbi:MAG: histidine kinase dimerization/phospho-acceptor domain-containing protein [Acidimicrobiia bacterium]